MLENPGNAGSRTGARSQPTHGDQSTTANPYQDNAAATTNQGDTATAGRQSERRQRWKFPHPRPAKNRADDSHNTTAAPMVKAIICIIFPYFLPVEISVQSRASTDTIVTP